jgi:diguanylate cyclase
MKRMLEGTANRHASKSLSRNGEANPAAAFQTKSLQQAQDRDGRPARASIFPPSAPEDGSRIRFLEACNASLRRRLQEVEREAALARHFAYHDELTGLPNRRLLFDRLGRAVAQAGRTGRTVVVMLLDLDGFKEVNDSLGHQAGDRILRRVARRLALTVREADTACRYGGDEFVLMLPEVEVTPDTPLEPRIEAVKEKLCRALTAPYLLEQQVMRMTVSIGVAVFPEDGKTVDQLMSKADTHMYLDKVTKRHEARTRSAASLGDPAGGI